MLALLGTIGPALAANDVDQLVSTETPAKGSLPPVRFLRDEGELAIVEVPGSYDRFTSSGEPNAAPRMAVAREFLRHHPDAYDFLIVFSSFEFDTGDAAAFYLGIRNDTAGIGKAPFDHREAFGTETLQGYIDMAALGRHELDSLAPAFDGTLDLMLHELMHRWGVGVTFIDDAGQRSDDLLGQHDTHWGYFVDTDASVMYGADWRPSGTGTFTAADVRRGYSSLDLYLAGFLPPEAVPDFFYVDGASGDPDALPPDVGTSIGGVARPVTIEQIIAAEGEREPAAPDAPRQFRTGFLLLIRPGDEVSTATLARLRGIRREFQRRFAVETRGLSVMDIGPPTPAGIQPSNPSILPTPDLSGIPADLIAAADWLLARQNTDGGWGDKGGAAIRDTALARAALVQLGGVAPQTGSADAWLRGQAPRNHDDRTWLMRSGALAQADLSALTNELLAGRNSDGGWGFELGLGSSPLDTALAILALRAQGLLAGVLDDATRAYVSAATDGGGWGAVTRGAGHATTNALMLQALAGLPFDAESIDGALGDLLDEQLPGGGHASAHETAHVLRALALYRERIPAAAVEQAASDLQSRQGVDGSWEGSVYATALAILALKHFDRANLELLAGVALEPAQPIAGELLRVSFTARNSGILETPETLAAILDAEPPNGSTITEPVPIPDLAPGDTFDGELILDTRDLSGPQLLFLLIDAGEAIAESSETDNLQPLEFTVAEAGDEPDLALVPGSVSFSPQIISHLPSPVQVDVEARNLSTLPQDSVAIALVLEDDASERELARVLEAFGAQESRIVRLEGSIDSAGTAARLRIAVDPDDQIAERNEHNNELRAEIPTGDALDLEIQPGDLRLTSSDPTLGQDAAIEVTVRNAGTVDAPPAVLRLEVQQGSEVQLVSEVSVQLAPGEATQRSFVWRANRVGQVEFRATIDPADVIAEGNESNNVAILPATVADVSQPNLSIDPDRIAFNPNPALEGQPLTIAFAIENQSTVAAGEFTAEVYEGVPGNGGELLGLLDFDGLGASGELVAEFDSTPLAGGGERLYFIVVDAAEQVAEFDESDNSAFSTVEVRRLPDLSVAPTSLALTPSVPVQGDETTATIQVDNLGQQPAAQVTVELFEVNRDGLSVPVADGVVAAIEPGGTETLELPWQFGQVSGDPKRIRVHVDGADAIAEILESNNEAQIVVQTANREFFVTERYFSPNGDGAKDVTTLAFEFAQSSIFELEILDERGRAVRTFEGAQLQDVRRGVIDWDGRDDRGVVVRDGDYTARMLEAGALRGQALVTVDTNRLPVLDAWGTDAAYFTDLRCSVRDLRLPVFSADGRHLLTGRIAELDGTQRTGLFRVATRGVGVESVITQSWWDSVGLNPFVEGFWPLPDGRIVFATSGRLYLLEAPLATPIRLDTGSLPAFDVVHVNPTAALIELDAGAERYFLISLDPSVAPLGVATPSRTMSFGGAVASGWLMLDRGNELFDGEARFVDRLWFVPAEAGRSAVLLNAGPDEVDWSVSIDGRYVASVAQHKPWDRFSQEPGSFARLRLSRVAGGEVQHVVDREYRSERRGALAAALSPRNRLLVLNGPAWRAEVYDVAGSLTGELSLPAQAFADYAADFLAPTSYVFGLWGDGGSPGGQRAVLWSSDRDEFLIEFALHILDDSGTKSRSEKTVPRGGTHVSQFLKGNLDDSGLELVGAVNHDADDAIIFPGQIDFLEPELLYWLPRTDDVLALPRGRTTAWRLDVTSDGIADDLRSGPIDQLWPTRPGAPVKRLYLRSLAFGPDQYRCAGAGTPKLVFESADNLIAHLEVGRFAAVVELRGVAVDRHFLSHRLEWARADAPSHWFALTSPSPGPVVDDLFASWVPPQPGNYLVRLTATDRAGNVQQSERSVAWLDPASLADVRLEPTHISPNGDGLQDSAVLSFRVLEPINLEATIENESGEIVRVLSGRYPVVTGDIEALSWDGRTALGQAVSDGRYLLRVTNRRFAITVDTRPPTLNLEIRPMLAEGQPPCGLVLPERCVEVSVADSNLNTSRLDFQTASTPLSELAPVAAGRTFVLGRDAQTSPTPSVELARAALRVPYAEGMLRLSAVDLAGNFSRIEGANQLEELSAIGVLTAEDGSAGFHLESSIVATVDQYFVEHFDPVAQTWVERNASPLTREQSSVFELPVIAEEAARYRPILPLDLRQDLPPIDPVRIRARAIAGNKELISNEIVFANPFGKLLRLVDDEHFSALMAELAEEAPDAAALAAELWRRFPTSGSSLSAAVLVAELPSQQLSLLAVESSDDPRYAGSHLLSPRGERAEGLYYAAIFQFPTAPCAGYQLTWLGADDTNGSIANSTASAHNRSCLSLTARASVLVGDFCAGQPTSSVELSATIESEDPQIIPTALNVLRFDQGRETLLANVVGPDVEREYLFEIDQSGAPEGQLTYFIEAVDSTGDRVRRSILLPIDHRPTSLQIDYPAESSKVCGEVDGGGEIFLPILGSVSDNALYRYRVSLASGHDAGAFDVAGSAPEEPRSCADGAEWRSGECLLLQGEVVGELARASDPPSGEVTALVEAVDWSGAWQCEFRRFGVDASVDVQVAPAFGVFSPNADGQADTGEVLVQALEPVVADVRVYPAEFDPATGWQVSGATLGISQSGLALAGTGVYGWSGDGLPDGRYALEFDIRDSCGLSRRTLSFGEIDTTPPNAEIRQPTTGATVPAIVEVIGNHADANPGVATLEYGQAGSWLPLTPQPPGAGADQVVARWPTTGLAPGAYQLRLTARDAVFNRAEAVVEVHVGDAPILIWDLEAEPSFFSPNADGVADATTIRLGVQTPGSFDVHVHDANGSIVATIGQDEALNPGTHRFSWAGTDLAGGLLPDGRYDVVVAAVEAAGGSVQTESISVTIDTTAPSLEVLRPGGEIERAAGFGTVEADDPHLTAVSGWIQPLEPAGTERQVLAETQAGVYVAGDLGLLSEGRYALRAEAADAAGNFSAARREFSIDDRPPLAQIDAPSEGDLLAGASVTVTGAVADENFANYRLQFRSGNDIRDWIDILEAKQTPQTDELGAWMLPTVDGGYALRLLVTDRAGWTSEAAVGVVIDQTPPSAVLSAPVDGGLVGNGATVSGTATDLNFAQYRLRLAPASGASTAWTDIVLSTDPVDADTLHQWHALPPDGRYRLQLLVEDEAGLSASTEALIDVDGSPPDAPTGLSAQLTSQAEVSLEWSPSAAGDIAAYLVYRNGAPLTETAGLASRHVDAGVPEGEHRYRVVARDVAGNVSEPSNVETVTIDLTPPEVAVIAPAENTRARSPIDIVGTATSADDFFEYRLYARAAGATAPGELLARSPGAIAGELLLRWDTSSITQERAYVLLLEAEDTHANIAAVTRRVIVDNVPPAAPSGLEATAEGSNGAGLSWTPNAESDLLGYLLSRDGQLVNAAGSSGEDLRALAIVTPSYQDGDIPDGIHSYRVQAIDLAGNVSEPSAIASIEIETGAPTVAFAAPAPGRRFEAPLYVLAVGEDQDIASVRFEYRSGAGAWVVLGAPVSQRPFEALLDAKGEGLSFGPVTMRAIAEDVSGQVDPTPPEIAVEYSDLTAPAAVTGAALEVVGGTVTIDWSAGSEADLAGYLVTRSLTGAAPVMLTPSPIGETRFIDEGLADGAYEFAVFAVDEAGNRSEPTTLPAIVHSLDLVQPFTPVPAPSTPLTGRSVVPGTVAVQVVNADGSYTQDFPTSPDGSFGVDALAIAAGVNTISLELTDAAGNRSKTAIFYVQHSEPPPAPEGLSATAAALQVDLSWSPPPGDVAGYRPFRDGAEVVADGPLPVPPAATASSNQPMALRAVDGNPLSYWFPDDADLASGDPMIEFAFSAPRLVTAARLEWFRDFNFDLGQEVSYRPEVYELQAWSGLVWVTLSTTEAVAPAVDSTSFESPYMTDRIRVLIRTHRAELFRPVRLAEVSLVHRPLVAATEYRDSVSDGIYSYRVSAVNVHGFEGPRSAVASVTAGDVTPPEPVVLSGSLAGRDASLSWTASEAPDLVEYRLFRNGEAILLRRDLTDRAFVDMALPNGVYSYGVVPVDAAGNVGAASNSIVLAVDEHLPDAPSRLTATAVAGGGAVDLTWVPPTGPVDRYRLKRAAQSGGPYDLLVELDQTQHRDSTVVNGETYFYVVTTVDDLGIESTPSNEAAATPRDDAPPPTPVLLHPTVAGQPIDLDSLVTDVAGAAQPGSTVEVSVNGILDGAVITPDRLGVERFFLDVLAGGRLSPSDPLVASTGDPDEIVDLETGERRELPSSFAGDFYWSPDGESLFIKRGFNPATLTRYDLGTGASEDVLSWAAIDFAAPAPDARSLFVQGVHSDPESGTVVRGLWLVAGSGSVTRIGDFLDPDRNIDPTTASWSADGARVAFVVGDGFPNAYQLWVYHLAEAELTRLHGDVDAYQSTAWHPDGSALAFIERGGSLVTVAADGTALTSISAGANRPRWSPDGRYLAYGLGCCDMAVRDLAGGEEEQIVMLDPAPARNWMPNGRMISLHNDGYTVISAPGFFVLDDVALVPGLNRITAVAVEASGLASFPSTPILVSTPGAGLPDPAVLSVDVNVLPRAGGQADPFRASVVVRNLSPEPADPVGVQLLLGHADGSAEHVLDTLIALDGFGDQPLSVDLNTDGGFTPGFYRLTVLVDALNQLAELDETNNTASVEFAVVDDPLPLLTLDIDAPSFAPGDVVTGVAEVFNAGPAFAGTLEIRVADRDGFPVGSGQGYAVEPMAFGASRSYPVAWEPGAVFAGDFVLSATLRDSGGTPTAVAAAPVSLDRFASFTLELTAAPGTIVPGESVALSAVVGYAAGNAPQRGTLTWYAVAPDGLVVWQATSPLPTLLPGASTGAATEWPAAGPDPGQYLIRAEFFSEDGFASADLLAIVSSTPSAALLEGEITPPAPVSIGSPIEVEYVLSNRSATDLAGVRIDLDLLPAAGAAPLLTASKELTLTAGDSAAGRQTWPGTALSFKSYLLVLRADLSAQGGPASIILDTATLRGIDGVAPELALITPHDGDILPADVLLRATAEDRLQRVASVAMRLDGGPEQRLGRAGSGEYQRWLFSLAEGPHRIDLSAADARGNLATVGPVTFIVDATPPVITLSGVVDGELRNAPVTPEVAITDLHPGPSFSLLNGAPFSTGQAVTAEGRYQLTVVATDQADNRAEVEVGFTIDLTAPIVRVEEPAAGIPVTEAVVPVVGNTEPGATVTLTSAELQDSVAADPSGAFLFPAVPLALGTNPLRLAAVDRAGNTGSDVVHEVTRIAANPELSGSLDAPASAAAGADLTFGYRLDNSGAAGAISVRIPLLLAGVPIATVNESVPIPATGSVSLTGIFEGDLLAPARHRIELQVDVGGVWETLANVAVDIRDLTGPDVALLGPSAGGLVAASFDVIAMARDDHSAVATVEYSIDGGLWQPLALSSPSDRTYVARVEDATDGGHRLQVRAGDTADNRSFAPSVAFEVDARAPEIMISGVADGALLNHSVSPVIDVHDEHPREIEAFLNGEPFVSGTAVSEDGAYELAATALDAVGNRSAVNVGFAIDTIAPVIELLSPASGDQFARPDVAVAGKTEPLSGVTLALRSSTWTANADSTGLFRFAAIPLQTGGNTVTLNALDRAGNRSADTVLVVTRVDLGSVRGELVADPAEIAVGRSLAVGYRLHNDGSVAIRGLESRVLIVQSLDDATRAEHIISQALGAQSSVLRDVEFPTDDWNPGRHRIELQAAIEGQGWAVLDSKLLEVIEGAGSALSVNVLFPASGSTIPSGVTDLYGDTRSGATVTLDNRGPAGSAADGYRLNTVAGTTGRYRFTGVSLYPGRNVLTVTASLGAETATVTWVVNGPAAPIPVMTDLAWVLLLILLVVTAALVRLKRGDVPERRN